MAAESMHCSEGIQQIFVNLSTLGFSLCLISAFSLALHFAGIMKQAYQILARAGVIAFVLMQWPLWNDRIYVGTGIYGEMSRLTASGTVLALIGVGYIVLTLSVLLVYRRRIDSIITLGLVVLLLGQGLSIATPLLREVGFASLVAVLSSAILGYRLARMQLYAPLTMQMTQPSALRNIFRALNGSHDLPHVLRAVAGQRRELGGGEDAGVCLPR